MKYSLSEITNGLKQVALLLTMFAVISSCNSNWEEVVIKEVTDVEQANAEMEVQGLVMEQFELLSDDYVYIDISGNRVTKKQLMARRDGDKRVSIENKASQLEVVPINEQYALARGKWEGRSIYYGGLPRTSSSRYMALWQKKEGKWQILADQVTPIGQQKLIERQETPINPHSLKRYTGTFRLETKPPLKIHLSVAKGNLQLLIPGELDEGMAFYPSNNSLFFSKERPWEIRFFQNANTLTFVSWGIETDGNRIELNAK